MEGGGEGQEGAEEVGDEGGSVEGGAARGGMGVKGGVVGRNGGF